MHYWLFPMCTFLSKKHRNHGTIRHTHTLLGFPVAAHLREICLNQTKIQIQIKIPLLVERMLHPVVFEEREVYSSFMCVGCGGVSVCMRKQTGGCGFTSNGKQGVEG